MLKILPDWADATVVRTRDPDALKECDIVVDVGGVYDPASLRFDHHQKGFETKLDGYDCTKVPLAAALVTGWRGLFLDWGAAVECGASV